MQHSTTTERFILRPFRLTDVDDFYEMDADPEVHNFLGSSPILSKAEMKEVIQSVLKQYEENGIGRWAIEDKITGEVVGWSGIKLEKQARSFHYYDVGYRLKQKHWGKGIASEVGIESMRYGFEEMKLDKLGGGAEVDHVVSNHILKKIGLVHTDTPIVFGKPHHWYEVDRENWMSWHHDKSR